MLLSSQLGFIMLGCAPSRGAARFKLYEIDPNRQREPERISKPIVVIYGLSGIISSAIWHTATASVFS